MKRVHRREQYRLTLVIQCASTPLEEVENESAEFVELPGARRVA
jgi:hypothetical protein